MDREIHIYQNRNRRFFHIAYFFMLTFVWLSITYSLYLQSNESWFQGFLFVIFLLLSPSHIMRFFHHLFKFFSQQPVFVLTQEGIWNFSRIGMRHLIKWEEIEHIFVRKSLLRITGDQIALYNSHGLIVILSLQATSVTGSDMIHYINKKKKRPNSTA